MWPSLYWRNARDEDDEMTAFWVGLGSAIGGVCRYWLALAMLRWAGEAFPWGTLLVNVLGSLSIGAFATLTAPDGRWLVATEIRQFVMLGLLGGFTTFSTFSLQTLALMQQGALARASMYVLGSVLLCVGGAWLGHIVAVSINR